MSKQYYISDSQTETSENSTPETYKKKSRKTWFVLIGSMAVFIFSTFLYIQASASPLSKGLSTLPWLKYIAALNPDNSSEVHAEEIDIINAVIIGMGGEGHDGGYLADTIILARFKKSTKQISLVSIPRDFAVNLPGLGWGKINNANAYGGPDELRDMLEDVLDEPVPYYISIDFSGFANLIDDLGGVDVYVERSFTDTEFPDDNYEYQTISFAEGMQHMDGLTALRFARSRHGNNGEGSDFARSARQQKIIFAVKNKILTTNTLINPTKLISLYNNYTTYVDTNMKPGDIIEIAQMAQGTDQTDVLRTVLTDGPNGVLEATIHESGAYLLIPKAGLGNYTDIRAEINSLFDPPVTEADTASTDESTPTKSTAQNDPLPTLPKKEPQVETFEEPNTIVLNGTTVAGYAGTVSEMLKSKNFNITSIANSNDQTLTKTIVYDLSPDTAGPSKKLLASMLDYKIETKLPADLEQYLTILVGAPTLKETDLIVILGQDNTDIIE